MAELPSPLESLPDMRAAAKWVIGAAASVGAVVLGGAPLAAASRLHTAGDVAFFLTGLFIALAGVGLAIWRTAEALVPPVTTGDTLAGLAGLREMMSRSPETFFGPFGTGAAELRAAREHHGVVAANIRMSLRREQDPARILIWQDALEDSLANVEHARRLEARVAEFVHTWQVRELLRRARLWTLLGMLIAAAGVTMSLLATVDITGR